MHVLVSQIEEINGSTYVTRTVEKYSQRGKGETACK